MTVLGSGAVRSAKALVERTCGIHISRTPPQPDKHADSALRALRRWSPDDVVFDVGANDGRTILRLYDQLSRPRVYAFEPVADTYRTLVSRTAHLPRVRSYHAALGAVPERRPIYLNAVDAMNSFSPGWAGAATGSEIVEVRTVDEVVENERIDMIHFLKVDTEGFELEVLQGAEATLRASRVALIQLEVGVDQMAKQFLTLEQARSHLRQYGYLLHGVYNQCHTPARVAAQWSDDERQRCSPDALAYCDALFVRGDLC